jgi:hypothetical protein
VCGARVCAAPVIIFSLVGIYPVLGGRARKAVDRGIPLDIGHELITELRYQEGGSDLARFAGERGWTLDALAESHARQLNELCMNWIVECFEEDKTRGHAAAGLLFMKDKFFWVRSQLQPSWRLIRSWYLREPIEMRNPASRDQTQAIISTGLVWGWWRFSLLVYLGFRCLLRPGEMLALRWAHIQIVKDLGVAVLTIMMPKTRKSAARRQSVVIDDGFLISILIYLKSRCLPGSLVGDMSYNQFYRRLEAVCGVLGLKGILSPSAFRAGGATIFWLVTRDFHGLRLRGRWMAPRSLEHYIQECSSFLIEDRISAHHQERIRSLSKLGKQLWGRALRGM